MKLSLTLIATFIFIIQFLPNKGIAQNLGSISSRINLSCEITKAILPIEPNKKKFILLDVDKDEVKLFYPDDKQFLAKFPLRKFFEGKDTLTFGWVAWVSGSTDMIVINNKTGEFIRTTSGNYNSIISNGKDSDLEGNIQEGKCQ